MEHFPPHDKVLRKIQKLNVAHGTGTRSGWDTGGVLRYYKVDTPTPAIRQQSLFAPDRYIWGPDQTVHFPCLCLVDFVRHTPCKYLIS